MKKLIILATLGVVVGFGCAQKDNSNTNPINNQNNQYVYTASNGSCFDRYNNVYVSPAYCNQQGSVYGGNGSNLQCFGTYYTSNNQVVQCAGTNCCGLTLYSPQNGQWVRCQ